MKGMNYSSLPPPDLACYAYAMVNRQDVLYSPGSLEIGRPLRLAEIVFDGTKLAIERSRPKTTTEGMNCSFQLFSISQNGARRTLTFAVGARSIDLCRPHERAETAEPLRDVGQ